MARTLDEIRASKPQVDRAKFDATTEADIRRHMIEDGHDPDAPLTGYVLVKRRPGERGPGKKPAKVVLNVRVEPALLEAYKATGEGWQRRVTEALRAGAPASAEELGRELAKQLIGAVDAKTNRSAGSGRFTGGAKKRSSKPKLRA